MKKIIIIIAAIIITSCNTSKNTANSDIKNTEVKQEKKNAELIGGSWTLEVMLTKNIEEPSEGNKLTYLTIYPEKLQFSGSDGCNNLNGGIKKLDETNIIFSQMISTKMLCPDMKIADTFTKIMSQVVVYKISDEKLFLYNKENIEILQFRKK